MSLHNHILSTAKRSQHAQTEAFLDHCQEHLLYQALLLGRLAGGHHRINCATMLSLCAAVVCIAGMEHLQSQRLEVAKAIKEEEAERVRIEQDMAVLQSRLAHIKESLQKKVSAACADEAAGLFSQMAFLIALGIRQASAIHMLTLGTCRTLRMPPQLEYDRNARKDPDSPEADHAEQRSSVGLLKGSATPWGHAHLWTRTELRLRRFADTQHVLPQVAAQTEYDRVIEETQTAYKQIVQSSEALLDILKRECNSLGSTEQQRGQLLAC